MAWSVTERKNDTKRTGPNKLMEVRPPVEGGSEEAARAGRKDLAGGMEMLEMDFLLGVIENTTGRDDNDVAMRKLTFNEVLRRQQQNEIDSNALRVYAIDESRLYGKDIQCEAMKELSKRTAQKG